MPGTTGWLLSGDDAALQECLERLHVRADVAGVREEPGRLEVWLGGPWPEGVDAEGCRRTPLAPPDRIRTGTEHDRVQWITGGLIVRPPWVARPEGFTGIDLVVPRGGAFGSGEHGSTRAALELLHAHWPRRVGVFADVGCGSGILAGYAAVRGCPRVLACDVDPAAVAATRALLPTAEVVAGGAEALPARADVVVANLAAAELRAALPAVLERWTGGLLVLSGLGPEDGTGPWEAVGPSPRAVRAVGGYRAAAFQRAR